ncbi:MAG TPA: YciI family protein [Methylomirabilota bacterium]|jgi:hypothetical protein|nr:YciI family protein [Methylomirabilota bacterium]
MTQTNKRFMLLLRGGIDDSTLSPEQLQQLISKYFAWMEKLRALDRYEGGEPLEDETKFLSGPGEHKVTDGPFTEAKEVVAGYFILRARDLKEAAEMARGCPILENGGTVEVRPIRPMPA